MTRDEFIEDSLYEAEHSFNAARPSNKRVPLKRERDRRWLRNALGRAYDKREMGKARETIRAELKEELFGSIWMTLLSFIWANWGDDIIAWILGRLFPVSGEVQ